MLYPQCGTRSTKSPTDPPDSLRITYLDHTDLNDLARIVARTYCHQPALLRGTFDYTFEDVTRSIARRFEASLTLRLSNRSFRLLSIYNCKAVYDGDTRKQSGCPKIRSVFQEVPL
jgi:hypothetical protein